uniref:Uncharacterized protein n=1 Tax=Pararge aegeria TaxID=116150 RepID=S4P9L2_9NEOP
MGRIIREGPTKQQALLVCLVYASIFINGRQVLQDILSERTNEHTEAYSCGMVGFDQWTAQNYEAECAEGGDKIIQEEHAGMVDATGETDERIVRKRLWGGNQVSSKKSRYL